MSAAKTYFIETWGCQMNDLDSQRLAGQLNLRGYRRSDSEKDADLILLNTCSIRDKSEHKVYSRLGELREEKARGAKIAVAGCVAQQEGARLLERAPYVDFILGPGNVGHLDALLDGKTRMATDFPDERRYDYVAIDRPSAVRAQITIIEGCNKNCTFCIVPTTRGREVSRPSSAIVEEATAALASGRVELELLGQTVNAYRCPETQADFADLLTTLAKLSGLKRLRFVTSHPAEVTGRLIEVIRDHSVISRYLHLPVQSGSSAVLRRMKRLYTREYYLDLIARFRSAVPEMKFSTDIIVGFPGESDEDFEQTLSLIREVRFGSLYAFIYSPRPGTPALRLGSPVDPAVAKSRIARVFAAQEAIEREALNRYVGRIVPVLYDARSKHDPAVLSGRTDDNWTVNFRAARAFEFGALVDVRVDRAHHHSLGGEAV